MLNKHCLTDDILIIFLLQVEVQFVDFGNRAVESFDSLAALHGKTRTVPLLSNTVKLVSFHD